MEYFYANGSEQRGPHTLEELRSAGLKPDTLVWHEQLPQWQRADTLAELADLFSAPAVAAPMRPDPISASVSPAITPAPAFAPATAMPISYVTPPGTVSTNGMAIASLVLGIASLALVMCYLLGIVPGILAIIFGLMARSQIRRGQGTGAGLALAGLICGSISVGIIVVLVLIFTIAAATGAFR